MDSMLLLGGALTEIMKRTKDWLAQAEHDVQAAKDSMLSNHHEWACFQSQQAAEKALKAAFLSFNID